jgi:hypothetical protein
MKTHASTKRRDWRLFSATLGVLALAGAGCNCISINIGGVPAATRVTTLAATPAESPAGGNFIPVQAPSVTSGSTTICGYSVPGSYVAFYPYQTAPAGYGGFQGRLLNQTTGADVPNSNYYLQWFVASNNKGCCAPVPGYPTEVYCPVTPGLAYRFTAYFKTPVPPSGTQFKLIGAWTDSEVDE